MIQADAYRFTGTIQVQLAKNRVIRAVQEKDRRFRRSAPVQVGGIHQRVTDEYDVGIGRHLQRFRDGILAFGR